jgi:prevent-host-death family protein
MTETYNVYEAKTHLSQLLERAAAGEEIIIAKAGEPQAMLVPMPRKKTKRVPGRLAGKIWVAPDAFSPEVDAEIWADFHDGDLLPPKNEK